MSYRWQSLDNTRREIRVLDLDAGAGESLLRGHLRHVSLDAPETPEYETISYAWGETALAQNILVDNEAIPIPTSAASALCCMRLPERKRTLWIDCICIDQNKDSEKSHQVALMADIFATSCGTLAFLGDDDDYVQRAFNSCTFIREALWDEDDDAFYMTRPDEARERDIQLTSDRVDLTAIKDTLSRPYFRRLWIVQEVVLSIKTTLCCGTTGFDFDDFLAATLWLSLTYGGSARSHGRKYDDDSIGYQQSPTYWRPTHQALSFLFVVRMALGDTDRPWHRALVLSMSRALDCYEPRDRVFGLLGLLQMSTRSLPLEPDYKKSISEIYRDATVQCINECGLWSLEDAGYDRQSHSKSEGLPTWVPNWFHMPIELERTYRVFPTDCKLWSEVINWSSLDVELTTHDANILATRGILLEVVSKHSNAVICTNGLTQAEIDDRVQAFIIGAGQLQLEKASQAEKTPQERLNDILAVGRQEVFVESAWRDYCQSRDMVHTSLRDPTSQSPKPKDIKRQEEDNLVAATSRLNVAIYHCTNRKVFATKSGRLGLGPTTMEDGDVIAVSKLSQYPMVLRPDTSRGEGFYTMVGAAYVEAIKDGEAIFAAAVWGEGLRTLYLV